MVTSTIPPALGLSDSLTAGRPSHIVVFRRPRASNVATLTQAIGGAGRAAAERPIGVAGRPGLLSAPPSAPVQFNYYQRFGVAAVSLDEAQRRELVTHSDVEGVYANLMRSIPRPVEAPSMSLPYRVASPDFRGTSAGTQARVGSPAEAYLMGMIDAASGALHALQMQTGGATSAAAGVQPPGELSWALRAVGIHAKTKWTGKGVKVAVLDTGLDRAHPDLQDRVIAYRNFAAGSSDNDVVGHGTHCAGIIAGSARPVGGIRYGVAPGVSLIVAKVLGDDGLGWDDDIIEAMDWAVDQGARVLSMSLGAPRAINQAFSAPTNNWRATSHRQRPAC